MRLNNNHKLDAHRTAGGEVQLNELLWSVIIPSDRPNRLASFSIMLFIWHFNLFSGLTVKHRRRLGEYSLSDTSAGIPRGVLIIGDPNVISCRLGQFATSMWSVSTCVLEQERCLIQHAGYITRDRWMHPTTNQVGLASVPEPTRRGWPIYSPRAQTPVVAGGISVL